MTRLTSFCTNERILLNTVSLDSVMISNQLLNPIRIQKYHHLLYHPIHFYLYRLQFRMEHNLQFKHLMDNIQQKQAYLREHILGKNYDPSDFILFINSKKPIGDNINLCSLEEIKAIVQQYYVYKEQQANSFEPLAQMMGSAIQIPQSQGKSVPKPKQILFTKYNPNLLQPEFYKNFQCRKVLDKYSHIKTIKCMVSDPQRKNTGGLFGIGGTSFLEFKVQTIELQWQVGRRYSDFVWLRSYLLKAYPSHIIPPVPQKKAAKRTQRHIQKRMKILQFFLNDLVSIRELLNDRYVEAFLSTNDNIAFQKLKKQSEKVPAFTNLAQYQSLDGTVSSVLSQQNKVFFEEMERKVPEYQRLYKQITRRGKRLQEIITQQVNTLYEMGNMFADLHQLTKQTTNKLPKNQGVSILNDIFITLNNMMIQWGNLTRNQHGFLQKNFNTFFKYVRNQFYGFTELIQKQQVLEAEYAKAKINLERKKQKVYSAHDPYKWELTTKDLSTLPKQLIHDKVQAFKVMLPADTQAVEKMKINLFFYINQFFIYGTESFKMNCVRYCENFKEFAIKIKVNVQQLGQLWGEMSANFSGPTTKKKTQKLKQAPIPQAPQQQFYDD